MRLSIEKISGNNICDVDVLSTILQKIKEFVAEEKYNKCTILSMNDDSYDTMERVDIELLLENVDYEQKIVKNQRWQKVFFIKNEILDCSSYCRRYLGGTV